MNQVFISGRLTDNVELRYTQSGTAFVSFTLAVERPKQKGAEKAEVDYIRCQAWQGTAEYLSKYASKGDFVTVGSGSIRTGSYTDKTGRKVYTTDVVVHSIDSIRRKMAQQAQEIQEEEPMDFTAIDGDQDIPF